MIEYVEYRHEGYKYDGAIVSTWGNLMHSMHHCQDVVEYDRFQHYRSGHERMIRHFRRSKPYVPYEYALKALYKIPIRP